MTKEEVFAYLKKQREGICTTCTPGIFSSLMDPLTQAALPELASQREGYVDIHAHAPVAYSKDPFHVCFLTWIEVTENTYMPYFTPRAPTLKKAINYFNEALRLEHARRHR